MKKAFWSVVLAVAVYTAMFLFSDARHVGQAVSMIDLRWIPLFFLIPLVNYFLRFLKWHYFLHRIDVDLSFGRSLQVFVSGFAMTVSPGKLGELLKCYLLRDREGLPVSRTSPVVVAERITDLISMILIAFAGILLVGGRAGLIAVTAGIMLTAAVMYVLLHGRAFRVVSGFLCRIPRLGKHRESFDHFQETCARLLDVRSLLVSVPLGVLSWGIEALVLCVVAGALGYNLPVGVALLAHSAGTIAGAVSMIPGGLGLTEVTIDGILTSAIPVSEATAVTLIMRFATLWFAVLLGVVTLAVVKRKEKRISGV